MPDPPPIDAAWDYADPAGSEGRFRAMRDAAGADADAGWRVELQSQLARAVCLQRRYDDAHAILDEVAALVPPAGRPRARWCLERGRIHNDTGRTAEAMAACEDALRVADDAGEHFLAADALHMLAVVAPDGESATRHRAALDYCLRHGDAEPRLRRWRLPLHLNLADALERLGRHREALDSVESAIAVATELGLPARVTGARVFAARLHRLLGEVERGREILESVFDPATANGWAWEERAESLLAAGRVEESRAAFREAHARLSSDPWVPPREAPRIERLRRLGGEGAGSA